jgi:hypothetical protein
MGHESLTQKILLPVESIMHNAKQIQYSRLSWHVAKHDRLVDFSICVRVF